MLVLPPPARLVALYGVRVRMIGACAAPFGTRITVCSLTPSRIAIMTSRFSKSATCVAATNFAGISGVSGLIGSAIAIDPHNATAMQLAARMACESSAMPPATDWKEQIPDDEAARFERYATMFGEMQARNGKSNRALHAKANLGVEAEFEVLADVPADAKLGMFAEPKTYRAFVRYSNGSPHRQADSKPDVRGIAVKVLGVAGKKLIPGMEDATTQDFLAIRTPSVPMRDADEFVTLVRAAQTPVLLPFKLIFALGFGRGLKVIKAALAGFKIPTAPLAATTYYSALASTYGPYAVHFAFFPHDAHSISTEKDLGEALAARLRDK